MVSDYKSIHGIYYWTGIKYLQYVRSTWGLRTPSNLRAGYPALLHCRGVGVRLFQAHGQQIVTTWIPRIETDYLLTRSMYIKMYIHANYSSNTKLHKTKTNNHYNNLFFSFLAVLLWFGGAQFVHLLCPSVYYMSAPDSASPTWDFLWAGGPHRVRDCPI